jgi:hypothetical protein
MQPKLRKAALIIHISLAVGWIGAVLAYLVLVGEAMRTQDAQTLRNAWIAMELIGSELIIPLAFGALTTGLIMSVVTPWGLFQHYWVVLSLGLTIVATIVLVQHMETVSAFAALAANTDVNAEALRAGLRGELLHAGLGLCVLIVVEVLNVVKPKGLTAYGRRRALEPLGRPSPPGASDATLPSRSASATPLWVRVVGLHALGLALLLVIVLHLAGGTPHP